MILNRYIKLTSETRGQWGPMLCCLFCHPGCVTPSAHKGNRNGMLKDAIYIASHVQQQPAYASFTRPFVCGILLTMFICCFPSTSSMSGSTLNISSTVQLPEDIRIPQLGFGVYLSPAEITRTSVTHALNAGYRHIDTAQIYRNEKQVGEAVRSFLLENKGRFHRQDIWITTKLRDEKGRLPKKLDNVPQLLRESVDVICGNETEMGGYVDLFLIHSPYAGVEGRKRQWQELEELKREGKTRAIGVSN